MANPKQGCAVNKPTCGPVAWTLTSTNGIYLDEQYDLCNKHRSWTPPWHGKSWEWKVEAANE